MSAQLPESKTHRELHCGQCGAIVPAKSPVCPQCHAPKSTSETMQAEKSATEPLPAQSESPKPSSIGFSLASLMMLVTLLSVVLGLFSVAPGLGILVTIALVPALYRTASEIRRRKSQGAGTTFEQKTLVFAASLAMVVVAGAASSGAFFTACWGGAYAGAAAMPPEEYGYLLLGAVIGGLTGIILAIWIFLRLMKLLAPEDAAKPPLWLLLLPIGLLIASALLWWIGETTDLFNFIDLI